MLQINQAHQIVGEQPETPPAEPSKPEEPSNPTETPEKPPVTNEPTWTETGDTVYALENLNVRKGYSSNDTRIGSLSKNDSTKRIAVGSNGWDKIEYNGSIGYVLSKYLTTEKPNIEVDEKEENEPTWTETGDTVYTLQKLNVRKGWGTSYEAIGMLKKGDSIKRIAVGSNGWDKIEYNGKTAYVLSKYLTTEKPSEEPKEENTNNTVENTNIVESNISVDQGEIYNTILDEIGVIPPVGKSIVDYIYLVVVGITIVMVLIVGIKIREDNKE